MNYDLKKTISGKSAAARYMERHQTLCVTLDKTEDKEIIAWLKKQPNRSESVRQILKAVAINDQT